MPPPPNGEISEFETSKSAQNEIIKKSYPKRWFIRVADETIDTFIHQE